MKKEKKILKATHQGNMNIGGIRISCAVLENGERVVSERSIANSLGSNITGSYWKKRQEGGTLMPRYFYAKFLEEFISDELAETVSNPMRYKAKNKTISNGLPADVLPEICDVWVKSMQKGTITETSLHVAENAYTLLKGFATVGIIALVDEATGYQYVRKRFELQEIFDKFLLKDYAVWTKRFPDEFFELICKLKNIPYDPKSWKRPQYFGHYINDIVYDRLAPGILDELKRRNPTEKGRRKVHHHRFLTEDIGHPALTQHIHAAMGLMRVFASQNNGWDNFKRALQRAFPKKGEQSLLDFENGDIEKRG